MAEDFGLPMLEAARRVGVRIAEAKEPTDRYLTLRGLSFHYLDWGGDDRPWLLCLHGNAQNAHMWDFTALAFCDRYHIIALDQRGHGDTDWALDGDYARTTHEADVAAFIEALGLRDVVLIGLSMGGNNAMFFTAHHPESVRALVAVDIGPETQSEGTDAIRRFVTQEDILDSFDAFVERVRQYSPFRSEWQIRGSLRHNLRQLPDGRWTWKYDPALRDPARRARVPQPDTATRWDVWKAISCSTLVVRGEQSPVLAREVADRMIASNPRSRLVEVPSAGHRVPGDNALGFQDALGTFLAELDSFPRD